MLRSKMASRLAAACDGFTPARRPTPVAAKADAVRLFVDVSVIARSDPGTGIQRVVRNLYDSLAAAVPKGCQVIPVVATRSHGYRQAPTETPLDDLKSLSDATWTPITPHPGDHFLALDLATAELVRHRAQLERFKHAGLHITVVVYDLLPVSNPAWFTARSAWRFRRWLRAVAVLADGCLCISGDVRDRLLYWLAVSQGVCDLPVGTIPMAHTSQPTPPPPPEPFLIARPTVLMVGTVEPRKGHACALDALDALWAAGHDLNLLVVGQPGWGTGAIQDRLRTHPENGVRLFWPQERVSDARLSGFYRHSAGLLLPSYGEGFGLPALEADIFGLPVLTRDLPVFREIAPNATRFSDDRSLADTLQEWLFAPPALASARAHVAPTWFDTAHATTAFIFGAAPKK